MVKFWTVRWAQEARNGYGVTGHGIVPLDDEHGIEFNASKKKMGRPKIRVADVYPLFETKDEAEAFRRGNKDFEVVACDVSLTERPA